MTFNRDDLTETASPFNNNVEAWKAKGYKAYLFFEGRRVATQERNIQESMNIERIRDVVEKIMKVPSGSVVSKTIPIIDGNSITIPTGTQIYAEGFLIQTDEDATVTITGSGMESIYCNVVETVYTPTDDPDLLNQATNFVDPETHQSIGAPPGYGQPGALAVKVEVTFSTSDGQYTIWRFNNGILQNAETPQNIITRDLLEDYERDISGNCARNAIGAYTKRSDNDSSILVVPSNIFYVDGKRISKIQDTAVDLPHAKTYEAASDAQSYDNTVLEYATFEYPVRDTSNFKGYLTGYVQLTRGNTPDTSDTICTGTTSGNCITSMNPQIRGALYSVEEVYTTTNGLYDGIHDVDYTIGSGVDDDCYKDGNNLNWSHLTANGATEPAGGSSYFAKIIVWTPFIKATRTKNEVENESIAGTDMVDLAHNDVFGLADSEGNSRIIIGDTEGGDDYTEGVDFVVINHLDDGYTNISSDPNLAWTESDYAQVHWLITPPGGTVYITYGYWTHTKEGHYIARDSFDNPYEPAINNSDEATTYKQAGFRNHISFNTATTEKPDDESSITYDYNVYRPRYDVIEISNDDNFNRVAGTPAEEPKFPEGHNRALLVCKLKLPADSWDITVDNQRVATQTQPKIRELSDYVQTNAERLEDLISSLGAQTGITRNDAEKKRFIDSFTDLRPSLNGGDIHYNTGGIAYSCRYDIHNRFATVGFSEMTTHTLSPHVGSSTVTIGNRLITLNRSLASIANTPDALKQLLASDFIKMNPYGRFDDLGPFIDITPPQDNWIETDITTYNENTGTTTFETQVDGQPSQIVGTNLIEAWIQPSGGTVDLRNTNFGQSRTLESAIATIRSRTVEVSGTFFTPSADNIYCTFDGQTVALTATGTTQAGTNSGTVKSNSSGAFTASFVIPTGVPTGSKAVKCIETTTNRQANSSYVASGIRRDVIQTILRPPVVPQTRIDPVGQTFTPDRDYDIGAINFYCKQKDSSIGGEAYIRLMSDGYPMLDNIAHTTFLPAGVSTSSTAATATQLLLSDSVSVNKNQLYFFGMGSNSSVYQLYYAKGGGNDITNPSVKISENAYGNGVMLTSPDAATWTADPISDMKFCLQPYVYSASGTLYFDNVVDDLTSFIVGADYTTRPGTSITWEYSLDNGVSWKGFQPGSVVALSSQANQIKVRVNFATTDSYVSPILINDVTLETRVNNASGKYIGRNITTEAGNEYHKAYVYYEYATPSGCTVTPYVMGDSGSWVSIGSPDRTKQINGEFTGAWKEYVFDMQPPTLLANDLTETGDGALGANTYYYKITATDEHGETLASTERSITVSGGSNSVTIDMTGNWPTGATGYKLYRGTSTNTETLKLIGDTVPTSIVDAGADPDAAAETPPAVASARDEQNSFRLRLDMATGDNAVLPKIANAIVILV